MDNSERPYLAVDLRLEVNFLYISAPKMILMIPFNLNNHNYTSAVYVYWYSMINLLGVLMGPVFPNLNLNCGETLI